MSPLQEHVESLFAGYKPTRQVRELKAEILSNLEAKVADLTTEGMEYDLAVEVAKANITSVKGLVEEQASYDVAKYRTELLQTALLYFLIAWIVTIPMQLFRVAENLSLLLPLIAVVLGIIYIIVRGSATGADSKTASFDYTSGVYKRNLAWIIWGIFVMAMTMSTTAIHMGSNIWFGRPLHISGPYQFGVLAANYVWPLVTIVIPLLFNASLRLKMKHEAGENHVD
ncbi:permease prefix domain 1-containing protein [Paenibacillus sp. KQZ6P-2]|uniref:Permease prefix domain 1-containing protein n=1 Tax=Paenibacillus mangrovi TaxID=2931978 RepID=A0A9X1WP41_9BACL|nr:permease prefix domain 1-containing protein [Paenibacillus mangrovi]MCJ8012071.1 permease prefix domain 1-containing protein [Paenibacillus mangrovi]